MHIGIVFYSFSGNTKKACLFIEEKLKEKNITSELIDLKPVHEEKSFLFQCKAAFGKDKLQLNNQPLDQQKYDFMIFASPVWAFTFAPALHAYLENIKDLVGKKSACLLTYGSGLGKNKALQELEDILKTKGANILLSKNISGSKTKNKEYLEEQLRSLIDSISA
ncbi:MAG: NAD(P)H-dependent oxidoreductase [Candidatus Omnitrophota bacterium]|jgi:flavodoxin